MKERDFIGCCKRCGDLIRDIPYGVEKHNSNDCKMSVGCEDMSFVLLSEKSRNILREK